VNAEPGAGAGYRAVDDDTRAAVADLASVADRLASLAESAELMGDDDGAVRYRSEASGCRLRAMRLLDRAAPSPR
jgi:hypothetical protein